MIVKIMSNDVLPDEDARKLFRLVSGVKDVQFIRAISPVPASLARIVRDDGLCYDEEVCGNVYVMNDAGKTVAAFSAREW